MSRVWALIASLAGLAGAIVRAAPAPTIALSAPGCFEVAALDGTAAEHVAAQAQECWQWLAAPLALPDKFSTPVFVRLVPAAEWGEAAPFRVIVEPGGVVSVRVSWSAETPESFLRRALVQSLLMRLAVAQHGVNEKLAAPLWLELGCVEWWRTHAAPAQLDALKFTSARFAPPPIGEILRWSRGEPEPPALVAGAAWLLAWLQAESGRAGEWTAMLRQLLAGESGDRALAANFPGRFASDVERELWWQTGWHHLRRTRALPTLDAADSRDALAVLARFTFGGPGGDGVTPFAVVLAHAREPIVDEELRLRGAELARLTPALHPFYRNAGLSLAEAFAARNPTASARAALVAAFERDWADARELESATRAALDALDRN